MDLKETNKLVVEGGPLPSMLPDIECEEASALANKFRNDEASVAETVTLGLHLVHDEIEHTEACPRNDEELKEQVIAFGRGSGDEPIN